MRSVAAWGSIPENFDVPGLADLVHVHIKCGIGIDYLEDTKTVNVALVFFADTEKVPFTKKETYIRLKTRLDVARPETLLWSSNWTGDPDKVKTELFAKLTGFFRDVSRHTSAFDINPKKPKLISNLKRQSVLTPVIRAAVCGWLHNNGATFPEKMTEQRFIPYEEYDQEWSKEEFLQYFNEVHEFFTERINRERTALSEESVEKVENSSAVE